MKFSSRNSSVNLASFISMNAPRRRAILPEQYGGDPRECKLFRVEKMRLPFVIHSIRSAKRILSC